jgi:DNA mismatch repair ATPase MutS
MLNEHNYMSFTIDKQTYQDLELFSDKRKQLTVFSIYNCLSTKGGQELLYQIFNSPTADIEFLKNRTAEIQLFHQNKCKLELNSRSIDYIEFYLNIRRTPLKANILDAAFDHVSNKIKPDNDYFVITESIIHISQLLIDLKDFIQTLKQLNLTKSLDNHLDEVIEFLDSSVIKNILENQPKKPQDLTYKLINRYDNYFRVKQKESFRNLLTIVYEIDFLQSMSQLISTKGFSVPEYMDTPQPYFKVVDAFHPFLEDPVKYTFEFPNKVNLCFLTGPNMSGKSTFLKTMGLLVYLSHVGLPVPSKQFSTSMFNGLISTINLSDNINQGYSHYFSEVNRVKETAQLLATKKNLVVIFDELFRGTNVKDAHDASLGIISALAKIEQHLFFISTHILEVAEELSDSNLITFKCFESEYIDDQPIYDFKIKQGITKERVGMKILEGQKILELLDEIILNQNNLHSL